MWNMYNCSPECPLRTGLWGSRIPYDAVPLDAGLVVVGNLGWVAGNLMGADLPDWGVGNLGLGIGNPKFAEVLGRGIGILRPPECHC